MLSLFMVLSFPAYYDNEKHFRLFSCFYPCHGRRFLLQGEKRPLDASLAAGPACDIFFGKKGGRVLSGSRWYQYLFFTYKFVVTLIFGLHRIVIMIIYGRMV